MMQPMRYPLAGPAWLLLANPRLEPGKRYPIAPILAGEPCRKEPSGARPHASTMATDSRGRVLWENSERVK